VGGYTAGVVTDTPNGVSVMLAAAPGTAGLSNLALDIVHMTNDRLRIRITDPANQRFEVPNDIAPISSQV
jgi:hypothetical protein